MIGYSLLTFIFISFFRLFATLPSESLHLIVSATAIIIFTAYYLFELSQRLGRQKITMLDLLIWLFILINLFSAYQANKVFGQPLYFGIAAQSPVLLCLSGMMLISLLNYKLITIRQVEKTFVLVSVSILIAGYFFFLFIDPEKFSGTTFVAYSSVRGYRFNFQLAPVIMLLFYALFKISMERKVAYSVIVLLILFYFVYFLQSRTSLFVLAVTLLVYFIKTYSLKQKIRNIFIYGGLMAIAVFAMFLLGYTDIFFRYNILFRNIVEAFAGTSDEASSYIRLQEYNTAIEFILKNPLFGNGFISNQWNGGWHGLFGYFYPVDIGILGNIFVYGLIGTIIIYLPFYFAIKMSREVQYKSLFYFTCQYMMLFFFLNMFFSAINLKDSATIFFTFCIIYFYRYHSVVK